MLELPVSCTSKTGHGCLFLHVLDPNLVTKYLHRTITILSSYYHRSKSYYKLNEYYDYSMISKFKNVLRMHTR